MSELLLTTMCHQGSHDLCNGIVKLKWLGKTNTACQCKCHEVQKARLDSPDRERIAEEISFTLYCDYELSLSDKEKLELADQIIALLPSEEARLDRDALKGKIEQTVYDYIYIGLNDAGLPYLSIQPEFYKEILALLPNEEEGE